MGPGGKGCAGGVTGVVPPPAPLPALATTREPESPQALNAPVVKTMVNATTAIRLTESQS